MSQETPASIWTAETNAIRVSVEPRFLVAQSDPKAGKYLWAYQVTVENLGPVPVRLVDRHWLIADALGRQFDVQGQGVVGEQPLIMPGDSYSYASGCPLDTASGMMRGSYGMLRPDGTRFEAQIPAFSLDSPFERPLLN